MIGITELKVKKFHAKIGFNNKPSLQLFQKKLGFTEVGTYLGCNCVFPG